MTGMSEQEQADIRLEFARLKQDHADFDAAIDAMIATGCDPLRIQRMIPGAEIPIDRSHVIFVLTEFQIADKGTVQLNEIGQSSHEAYKARQHEKVKVRLLRSEDDPVSDD